jgi:hypothetical protein
MKSAKQAKAHNLAPLFGGSISPPELLYKPTVYCSLQFIDRMKLFSTSVLVAVALSQCANPVERREWRQLAPAQQQAFLVIKF